MSFWDIQRDPLFGEFSRLQRDMANVLSYLNDRGTQSSGASPERSRLFPPMNVQKQDNNYQITAEIPGVNVNEIDLTVQGDTLTIKGERKPEVVGDNASYHRRERSCGAFQRSITLPEKVDPDRIGANYKNGVLVISLPLDEATGPRKIAVTAE
ncbi:MAG: Hsp20/alpha crystallin family protein [Pseudomonadota bacterium]